MGVRRVNEERIGAGDADARRRWPARRRAASAGRGRPVVVVALAVLAVLLSVAPALAVQDAGGLAAQRLGRGYTHVFIAYGLAWLLVLAWIARIARLLGSVERRLGEG